jgi:protein TonB
MNVRMPVIAFLANSLMVHSAFVLAMAVPDNSLSAAGPPPALTAQGNSFADMVQGSEASVLDTSTPSEVTDQTVTVPTPSASQTPTAVSIESVDVGLQLLPEELSEILADVAASSVAAIVPIMPEEAVAIQPTEITSVQTQILEALPEVEVGKATSDTVRPQRRSANLGQTPPPPRQTQQAQQAPSASQGNADQDARRGANTTAQNTRQATQSGQGQQVDQVAVAAARQAAADYGNVVMRRISRTRRVNIRSRGVAVVSFRVGALGQLTVVQVGQSSGDMELDRIAINHVRRAAPFPAPPAGAQTSFSIQFQGR